MKVCYKNALGGRFFDYFGWTQSKNTRFLGYFQSSWANVTVSRWALQTSRALLQLDVLRDQPNRPITLSINGTTSFEFLTVMPAPGVEVLHRLLSCTFTYDFLQISAPIECSIPPAPCSDLFGEMTLPMVRLQGNDQYEIADTNSADYVGGTTAS